ncbi:MAG TPA: N-acetylmuramoyl-L-alanine amidase [Candidatus Udaeobacter sp.]|nr:N-acetylmuramoyl-L-alanine amidase [Candidatus Udaeobacter sp.]
MFAGQKNLHKMFAPVSLGFVLALAVVTPAKTKTEAATTANLKRQSASAQFSKAQEQRAALNSKASEKRTLADYKQVIAGYHRVSLITPRAQEVPDSLLAMAELYVEMGDRFGRSYYQSAADAYQFLVREYPTNKHCQDAMLRIGKLQRDQLGEAALAERTYDDFLKRYPRSPRKREAQEALAELALLQHSEASSAAMKAEANSEAPAPVATEENSRAARNGHFGGKSGGRTEAGEIPRVRRIRAAVNGEATRVTIDLEDSVQYSSGRIAKPDRIFFDLHAARLTPELARENIHVEGDLLTAVRVAQNHAGVVRIVLDVNGVKDYSASLTNNPPQLLIDLYGSSAPVRTAKSKRGQGQASGEDARETAASNRNANAVETAASENPSEQPVANSKSAINGSVTGGAASSTVQSSTSGTKNSKSKAVQSTAANGKPDLIQPVTAPQPTRDGQSTLTRTLGLKVGRIVIDPGHGGHDTGTIGPSGLMEKDLCLDVALRLGKIIQQRLPGAEVVYTRSDDAFIPLEERTNIANEAKADLFISIHANSSQNHAARGIETYYLNLKGTAEAMEVAARENATAQEGVHDLQDLVKKIARTEKIDESKEFAEDIQDSLSKRIQTSGKPMKNRGVRKAPFVVLIGADMPSILTEISFLSNPADEKLLKKPEQRQKVAEGLYQGVASYLQSMNSVTVNLPGKPGPVRPPVTTAVEQSRNQN